MSFLGRILSGLGGTTTGRAGREAGASFMDDARAAFTRDARLFQKDKSILSATSVGAGPAPTQFTQALDDIWNKSADETAFRAEIETVNKNSALANFDVDQMTAFRNEVYKADKEGKAYSQSGMEAMLKNQAETGNMHAGFSRAGATASPNALLRAFGDETGGAWGSAGGIIGAAALAGGANTMMGGDFFEGAAVGGGVAFGVRGIAKGVAGSMGDIEQSMMKNILGDDMIEAGTRSLTKKGTASKGQAITDLSAEARANLKVGDVNPYNKGGAKDMSIDDYITSTPNTKMKVTKGDIDFNYAATEDVYSSQARRENLNAISDMADDNDKLQGFGKKKMRDLLSTDKKKNVAMNNRMLTLGGGMLGGVAFTGQSDKRDYRRGFNAHRGNRI